MPLIGCELIKCVDHTKKDVDGPLSDNLANCEVNYDCGKHICVRGSCSRFPETFLDFL